MEYREICLQNQLFVPPGTCENLEFPLNFKFQEKLLKNKQVCLEHQLLVTASGLKFT